MRVSQLFQSENHPVAVTPWRETSTKSLCEYLSAEHESLRLLLSLHGAILFRGFKLKGAEEFDKCVQAMGAKPFGYQGGNSPRSRIAGDILTSTEYPASELISLHNEMSYLPNWPKRIFFYCEVPALSGGQTSLGSGTDITRELSKRVTDLFSRKKLCYIRNFSAKMKLGKTWQETYGISDRGFVEEMIRQQGSTFAWAPDGSLRVTTTCDGLVTRPETAPAIWFNQAEQWHPSALNPEVRAMLEGIFGSGNLPHHCEFEGNEQFDESMLDEIRRTLVSNTLFFNWERGDLIVIDNVLMMHGRQPFSGPRRTLAYLSST